MFTMTAGLATSTMPQPRARTSNRAILPSTLVESYDTSLSSLARPPAITLLQHPQLRWHFQLRLHRVTEPKIVEVCHIFLP